MKKSVFVLILILSILNICSTKGQNLVKSNFTGCIVPQFMCSGNTTRLPVVYSAKISGLKPNVIYRYYNQMASYSDFEKATGGVGNPIFMGSSYSYTSNTSLSSPGQYSQFNTDSSGNFTGWFCTVNTGNVRFTPGLYVYPTIIINDGNSGTTITARYALNDSIKVMAFGTSAGSGYVTGIYGSSNASAKNIILLYNNCNRTGRPVSATYVESEAIIVSSVPTFYSLNVDGIAGAWGSIIPNDNPEGIRNITQVDLLTGNISGCAVDNNGIWPTGNVNTTNPTGGTNALNISNVDAPLNNCNQDTTPPKVDTAFAISPSLVKVVFNENVDSTAEIISNYGGLGQIISATHNNMLDTITLNLNNPLAPEIPEYLTITNIQDNSVNHNKMMKQYRFEIKYGKIPFYKIIEVRDTDAVGNPDSLNIKCKLTGIVQSNSFVSSGHYFWIHDGTAGICVIDSGIHHPTYQARTGDSLFITGTITGNHGLTEFRADSIEVLDSFLTIKAPIIVSELNEWTESELIKIKNLHLVNPSEWPVSAGITKDITASDFHHTFIIRIEEMCNLQGTPAPVNNFDLTGIGFQYDSFSPFNSGYMILPRTVSDIEIPTETTSCIKTAGINLYPNPNHGSFVVENNFNGKTRVSVLNTLGQSVYESQGFNKTSHITLKAKPGIYFVKIQNENDPEIFISKMLILNNQLTE